MGPILASFFRVAEAALDEAEGAGHDQQYADIFVRFMRCLLD
jgi:hypothetical protein